MQKDTWTDTALGFQDEAQVTKSIVLTRCCSSLGGRRGWFLRSHWTAPSNSVQLLLALILKCLHFKQKDYQSLKAQKLLSEPLPWQLCSITSRAKWSKARSQINHWPGAPCTQTRAFLVLKFPEEEMFSQRNTSQRTDLGENHLQLSNNETSQEKKKKSLKGGSEIIKTDWLFNISWYKHLDG